MTMTCSEACAILRSLPLECSVQKEDVSGKVYEAQRYYAECHMCRPQGLANILGRKLTCQKAVEVVIGGADLLYDIERCMTLRDVLAHEHVYGPHVVEHVRGRDILSSPRFNGGQGACTEKVCSDVANIWNSAPLCSHYDGDDEVKYGVEWSLDAAKAAGWNITPLVDVAEAKGRRIGKHTQRELQF